MNLTTIDKKCSATELSKGIICEGGGFSSFWYCLGKIYHKNEKYRFHKIDGFSSGAIIATLIVCINEININDLLIASLKNKSFSLAKGVYNILDMLLPENAHLIANNKLGIILCNPVTFEAEVIRNWESREMLINCVVASTYIPYISGFSYVDPIYKCIDGWFSKNLDDIYKDHLIVKSHRFSIFQQLFYISADSAKKLFEDGITDSIYGVIRHNSILNEIYIGIIVIPILYHVFTNLFGL
jgi:hypothetical protein